MKALNFHVWLVYLEPNCWEETLLHDLNFIKSSFAGAESSAEKNIFAEI